MTVNKLYTFLFVIFFAFNAQAGKVDEISSGGVKAWVLKDNTLPVIAVKIAFKGAGFAHDPAGKQGVANFVSGTLNEGAGQYNSQQFQRMLDENAIELGYDADKDDFYITMKTVTSNLDLALKLLKSSLTEPLFNSEDIERVRAQIANNIHKADESGDYLAAKKFAEIMFPNHPYANLKDGTITTLNNISAEDLVLFVANKFARDNITIGIVGDVTDSSAQQIISQITEKLPQNVNTNKLSDFTTYPVVAPSKVTINNPQTKIIFGSKGVKRGSPEFFPAYVLNHILGGDGFQAHLVKEVREKRGLAYYIGTSIQNLDHADILIGAVGTTAEQEGQVIALIKSSYADLQKAGVSKAELDDAKGYLTGSFALNLDKNEKLAAYLVMMQQENLGMDYLEKRNSYIQAVTLEQVNNEAKLLLSPDSLVFVSAGQ